MAISPRQWRGLVDVLGIANEVAQIEQTHSVSFAKDEGVRFEYRDLLNPLVAEKVSSRQFSELTEAFDGAGACWGLYQTMKEAVHDPALVTENPVFSSIENGTGHTYPSPGALATIPDMERGSAVPSPKLGEHSREVLESVLKCSPSEIDAFVDNGIVGLDAKPDE